MINWKPWSNPPDDCMRTKQQHVHPYKWKYLVVLLEFHKKSDLSHSPINIDTYCTLCSAKDLADLALFQRTVGLGHISMLWRSILLVYFQRLPQWGSSIAICTSSLGDSFRVSLVCITCITQDSQYFEMFFWLLSSPIWEMLPMVPASTAQQFHISCEQPLSCTSMVYLDLYLSGHIVPLQQSRSSSLVFFAGSFSLMISCYETLLCEVGAPDSSSLKSTIAPCFTCTIKPLERKSHWISWALG